MYSSRTSNSRRSNNAETQNESNSPSLLTLPQYLQQQNVNDELSIIISQAASACIQISRELARLPITSHTTIRTTNTHTSASTITKEDVDANTNAIIGGMINVQGEEQKPMDVLANDIFIHALQEHVAAMASEEEEDAILGHAGLTGTNRKQYEIAFDPLDGSSNLDVSVPTGTIFAIAPFTPEKPFSSSGRKIVAAGYTVYSSSVELVISLSFAGAVSNGAGGDGGDGSSGSSHAVAAGFTLDPTRMSSNGSSPTNNGADCFILSRPSMNCPKQGSYYSLNDAREPDWPQGLQKWIHDAKRGQTPSGVVYSSRYICSLCADVHRTLIKGGWAGNPRPHLRLLYEAAPLAHIAEACGGRGSDGVMNLLDIEPQGLHDRTSVFIGSVNDVIELERYGDVQQSAHTYKC